MAISELLSRRGILLGLGAVGGGAAATGAFSSLDTFRTMLGLKVNGGRRKVALATAEFADWSLQVGTRFVTHTGHQLTLLGVQGFTDRKDRPDALRDRAFVARFQIDKGGPMAADLYTVNHPSGGTFMIRFDPPSADDPLKIGAVFG